MGWEGGGAGLGPPRAMGERMGSSRAVPSGPPPHLVASLGLFLILLLFLAAGPPRGRVLLIPPAPRCPHARCGAQLSPPSPAACSQGPPR